MNINTNKIMSTQASEEHLVLRCFKVSKGKEEGELNGAEALSFVCKNMQMDIMHHLKCTWFHFYLVPQGLQFFLSTQVPKIQPSFSQVNFSNWNEKHYNNLSFLKGKLLWNTP